MKHTVESNLSFMRELESSRGVATMMIDNVNIDKNVREGHNGSILGLGRGGDHADLPSPFINWSDFEILGNKLTKGEVAFADEATVVAFTFSREKDYQSMVAGAIGETKKGSDAKDLTASLNNIMEVYIKNFEEKNGPFVSICSDGAAEVRKTVNLLTRTHLIDPLSKIGRCLCGGMENMLPGFDAGKKK